MFFYWNDETLSVKYNPYRNSQHHKKVLNQSQKD